jgi:anti-anti-sigma factor
VPGATLELSVDDGDGWVVVAIRGEFDAVNKPEVTTYLEQFGGLVILDLSECTFVDSSAVSVLIDHERRLHGDLVIRSPQPNVRRVLEVLGLTDWIE